MAKYYTEEEFYQKLKEMKARFRTQEEFAKSLKRSPQYISDVMKQRRSIIPIAKQLGYEIVFKKSAEKEGTK